MTQPNGAPPPGWYPDPLDRYKQRYWDGQQWTDHTQPARTSPSPLDDRGASQQTRSLPWWQSWWVIVPGLLLCLPLGLIGLWKRPGLTNTIRWWTTGGAAALLVLVAVLPNATASQERTAPTPGQTSSPAQTQPPTPSLLPSPTPSPVPSSPVPSPRPSPRLVTVPEVVGLSRADARGAITRAGLKIGRVAKQPSGRHAGTVLRESPSPGSKVEPRSEIALLVAKPFPRVPDVVGLSKKSAIQQIRSAGFRFAITTQTTTSGTNHAVLSQSPSGRARSKPGTTVHLVISHLHAPAPPPAPKPPPQQPACTTTSTGNCIQGGEFCPQADYGTTGYDANGTAYTCTGDQTHPHWE